MAIRIWYTISINEVGDKVGAEVLRNWEHPRTRGAIPIWAKFFNSRRDAEYHAEQEAAYAVLEQQQRNLCQA